MALAGCQRLPESCFHRIGDVFSGWISIHQKLKTFSAGSENGQPRKKKQNVLCPPRRTRLEPKRPFPGPQLAASLPRCQATLSLCFSCWRWFSVGSKWAQMFARRAGLLGLDFFWAQIFYARRAGVWGSEDSVARVFRGCGRCSLDSATKESGNGGVFSNEPALVTVKLFCPGVNNYTGKSCSVQASRWV